MDPKGLPQLFSPITAASGNLMDQQQMHMLHLLQKAQQPMPEPSNNTVAMEANLRALIMGAGNNNSKVQGSAPPGILEIFLLGKKIRCNDKLGFVQTTHVLY
jgi:hypothetical protein